LKITKGHFSQNSLQRLYGEHVNVETRSHTLATNEQGGTYDRIKLC